MTQPAFEPPAPPPALEWVRPPQQARSQRTLVRLLDAAEALIEERGVDKTTVSAIARRAGSSVGAFYARFGDKESLLRCLFDRFYEQAGATARAALDPERWSGVPLERVVAATVEFTARVFAERRGLIAAMVHHAATRPEIGTPAHVLGDEISRGMLALARHRGERFDHPDPGRAVGLCVWMLLSSLATWAHAGSGEAPPADSSTFAAEVSRMCLGYLFTD